MNILKRLLNVATILGTLMTTIGLINGDISAGVGFAILVFGVILTVNYVFFQKITIWHKLEKPKN
jgi:hypothetical protein